jgi:hypothetical protein
MNLSEQLTEREIKVINRLRNHRRIQKYIFTILSVTFFLTGFVVIYATCLIIYKTDIDNWSDVFIKDTDPNKMYPGYYLVLQECLLGIFACFLGGFCCLTERALPYRDKLLLKCFDIIESDQNEKVDDTC